MDDDIPIKFKDLTLSHNEIIDLQYQRVSNAGFLKGKSCLNDDAVIAGQSHRLATTGIKPRLRTETNRQNAASAGHDRDNFGCADETVY